jgi:hypothetical protein
MRFARVAASSFEGDSYYFRFNQLLRGVMTAALFLIALTPGIAGACACGCSVFDVDTPSLIPNGPGGQVWVEEDWMNQYIDWHSSQPAARASNDDKQIKTYFTTVGAQYMFSHDFGAMVTVPYWARDFRTVGNNNEIDQYEHGNFGDVRLWGMYTGLLEDMSLGMLVGFKLPTGDFAYPHFDRDTSIGTGSTDLLIALYKTGSFPNEIGNVNLTFRGRPFQYFAQGQYEYPFLWQERYVPGKEFDGSLGVLYNFGDVGPLNEVAPILSVLTAIRSHDQGFNADPADSGYKRLIFAAGAELGWRAFRLYADVEVPVAQYYNGYQLVAPYTLKTILSYNF